MSTPLRALAALSTVCASFACSTPPEPTADPGDEVLGEFVGHVSASGTLTIVPRERAGELGETAAALVRQLPVVNDGVRGSNPAGTFEIRTEGSVYENVWWACEGYSIGFCADIAVQSFLKVNARKVAVQVTTLVPAVGRAALNSDSFKDYAPRFSDRPGATLGFWIYEGGVTLRPGQTSVRRWVFDNTASGDFYFYGRVLGETFRSQCQGKDLGSAIGPAIASGSTAGAPDSVDVSCSGRGSGDQSFTWTAPHDGRFAFDTFGSDYDTVLSALGTACDPNSVLACSDYFNGPQSRFYLDMTAGQVLNLVVDGAYGSEGNYVLNVTELPGPRCPDQDLGSAVGVGVAVGSLADAPDTFSGACLPMPEGPDVSYLWTAPDNHFYLVSATSRDRSITVAVSDAVCGGEALLCAPSGGQFQAVAGQTYTFIVSSYVGSSFNLSVEDLGPPICPDFDLGSNVGLAVASGATFGAQNTFTACGGPGGDHAFHWVAPSTGTYQFDTYGSDFDTMLGVLGSCDASTLMACNDDWGNRSSRIVMDVTEGQELEIVIDGYAGNEGNYVLNITQSPGPHCPDADLGTALGKDVVRGSLINSGDSFQPTCGGIASDLSYHWTAPSTGTFEFIPSTDFDSVVSVYRGVCDTTEELACGYRGTRLDLVAGDVVTIVITSFGAEGNVSLGISEIVPPVCPDADLGSMVGESIASGTTIGQLNRYEPTCAFSNSGDAVLSWTAPSDGRFEVDLTGSDFDAILYVHEGVCSGGPELACADAPGNGGDVVTLDVRAGQVYSIVVDGWQGTHGSYLLSIREVAPPVCPMFELNSAVGMVAVGSTFGQPNDHGPSCASSVAGEVSYAWTAPATGSYLIDTIGSGFDTTLYVLDGVCGASELVCDDDGAGSQSSLVLSVLEGQVVTIIVDGFGTNEGDYFLNITPM